MELPTGVALPLATRPNHPPSSPSSQLTNREIKSTKTKNTPKKAKTSSDYSAYGQASCSTSSRQESLSVKLSKVVCLGGYSDSTDKDRATESIGVDDVSEITFAKSVIGADLGPHLQHYNDTNFVPKEKNKEKIVVRQLAHRTVTPEESKSEPLINSSTGDAPQTNSKPRFYSCTEETKLSSSLKLEAPWPYYRSQICEQLTKWCQMCDAE